MSLKVDRVQLQIILKSDTTRAEIIKLEDQAKQLDKEWKSLKKSGDDALAMDKKTELDATRKKIDDLRNSIELNGKTMRELQQTAKGLQMQLNNLTPGNAKYTEYRAELDKVNARMKELRLNGEQAKNTLSQPTGGVFGFLQSTWSWAAMAAAEVGSLTKEFTTVALEAEKSMQRLSFAVKTVGGGSDSDLEKLKKQAEDLMGIFSHEEIEGAATKMLNFGLSTEQVFKLIPLMVDAAAASGKSLDDIATAVDKGTDSGVMARSALGQLGLAFKDTGSKAENYRLITEGLTKFTGGNEVAMKSQWGTLANLKIRWEEVQETIGNFMLKAFIPLAERTTSLITDIPKLGSLLLNIGKAVLILAGYYAAYNGNLIAHNFLLKEGIGLKIKKLVQDAYEAVVLEALIIKEALHAAVVEKTTLASKAAAVAQTLWNLAMEANPLGVIIGALTTVVGLIFLFGNSTREATAAQQALIDVNKSVNGQIEKETFTLESYAKRLSETAPHSKERNRLVAELNGLYPDLLRGIDAEGASVSILNRKIEDYIKNMGDQIRLKVLYGKITETISSLEDEKDYTKRTQLDERLDALKKEYEFQLLVVQYGEENAKLVSRRAELQTKLSNLEIVQAGNSYEIFQKMWKSQNERQGVLFTSKQAEQDALNKAYNDYKDKQLSIKSDIENTKKDLKTIDKIMASKDNNSSNNSGGDDGSLDKAAAQKKKVDDAMKALETQNYIELFKIKKSYLDGDIKTEFDYNQSLLKQSDKFDAERKKSLQALLKTVTDPSLKAEIQNKIAEIDKQDIDRRVDHLNKIKKILADADPIQAEKDAYNNRLRELGIFGIAEEKLTKDQQNALKLLKIEHENKIKEIEKKADDEKLKISEDFYKDGIKAIDINNETSLLKLQDSLAKKEITQSEYDVYEKQLAIETANAKLILAQATYDSIAKIDFQNEDDKKKALENAKKEIDKLKNLLTSAGIDLENVYAKVGKDIGKSIEDALGQSFPNVANLFKSFSKSFMDETGKLTTKNLKDWKDWSKAVGELVEMALTAAIQINDEYYADKAAGLEVDKQTEYSALEKEKEQKLSVASLTEEQKQKIEDDYAKKKQDSDQAYAQKELDLKKEQSSSDTTLKVAQAAVAGGLAIVQAYAQLGPIFGTAAALLIGTITGLQIDTMLKQNSAIQATTLESTPSSGTSSVSTGARLVNQAAEGRYDVVGAQDGKRYNGVRYAGRATTGMVTTPTLMGEAGTELVIDAPTLNRLNLKAPNFVPWVLANRVQQRAEGKYDTAQNQSALVGADNSQLIAANIAVMNRLSGILDNIEQNGVKAPIVLSELEAKQALRDKSLKKGSLKT